jgi:alpha-L-fucosidase
VKLKFKEIRMAVKRKEVYEKSVARTRDKRMKWWSEARYGMFVHWGLYAFLERNEWVQAIECIPVKEYEKLAQKFKPKPNAAREWAKLARDSGMKYMVMTTKHHEGFCLWDTEQTDYNAVKTGCGRDLVREYVDACREFGLKIGFYYSLMDWHHPDGASAASDPDANGRFREFTKGCVRELLSNYGKIDILWYDVPLPMQSHEGWGSLAINQMARELQPHILINNRSRLDEDFSTPEGHVNPAETGRGWEACMTFNDTSWGYMPAAAQDSWTDRDILKMLNTSAGGCGNLLLNIGPAPDGSVPEEAVAPLKNVGKWLAANGKAVYGKLDRTEGSFGASASGAFSRRGKRVYFWVRCWPGREMSIGGYKTRLKSARFHVGGKKIDFEQEGARITLKNMPRTSPDKLAGVTVIELDFVSAPRHQRFATTPALWDRL